MFVYAAIFVGPFLERASQFNVTNFDENILLDYGFVVVGNRYIFSKNNMKIIVWNTDKPWCWDVCCDADMEYFMEWVDNAVAQYKDTKLKRGPSSWVDYVG